MTRLPFALVVFAAGVWAGTRADPAAGCAAVPRPGEDINIDDEAAYIVWDEKAKTEHFIRRATFAGTSADFGFLVPTPNRPQLEAVATDPNSGLNLFDELAAITAAKYEYRTVVREVHTEFGLGCMGSKTEALATKESMPASGGGVQVLEQKRVGDYDAAVLTFRRGPGEPAAAGAAELTKWLADHGYQSSPALKKWLERYVEDEWCMTAFKIASGAAPAAGPRGGLQAQPIRMSFKADKPVYPYREPAAEAGANAPRARLLRVFFAAPARFAGTLGAAGAWPGQTVWSGPVESGRQAVLFGLSALTGGAGPDGKKVERTPPAADGWWLTEFEDRSSPRPGTDEVYFARAADQTPVARPTVIVTHTRDVVVTPWWHGAVYLGVPVMLVVGGLLAWRLLRRA